MTVPSPVFPVRGSRAERVRSKVCAAFKRSTVAGVTVIARVALLEPDAFVAVRRTLNAPEVVYTCVGFCCVDVPPSPKSHAQEVALPDESVNWTTEFAAGFGVETLNDAAGALSAVTAARTVRPTAANALKSVDIGNEVITP